MWVDSLVDAFVHLVPAAARSISGNETSLAIELEISLTHELVVLIGMIHIPDGASIVCLIPSSLFEVQLPSD